LQKKVQDNQVETEVPSNEKLSTELQAILEGIGIISADFSLKKLDLSGI
jgi:hypothetical protein